MSIKDPHLAREQEKYENPIPSREFILEHIKQRQQPAYFEELAAERLVGSSEANPPKSITFRLMFLRLLSAWRIRREKPYDIICFKCD